MIPAAQLAHLDDTIPAPFVITATGIRVHPRLRFENNHQLHLFLDAVLQVAELTQANAMAPTEVMPVPGAA